MVTQQEVNADSSKKAVETGASSPPSTEPPPPEPNPYSKPEAYKFLAILVVILIVIGWIGINIQETNRVSKWFSILLLMAAFAVVVGRAITGHWRGILIDSRNKLSLSRLQMITWTVVVLSAILASALSNVGYGWDSPLDFTIPTELWVAMGISTVSLVASPAILNTKTVKGAAPEAEDNVKKLSSAKKAMGLVVANYHAEDARWSDLLMGEEVGNFQHVDLGKLQMFLISFVLILSYAAALAAMFREPGVINSLPNVAEGMNVLLGISHTGYLSNKAITHTPEAPAKSQT